MPKQDWRGARILASVWVSFLSLMLLGIHVLTGSTRVDATAMILVLLFFLPWVWEAMESFEAFGLKVKTRAQVEDLPPGEVAERKSERAARASGQRFALNQRQMRLPDLEFEELAFTALVKAGAREIRRSIAIVTDAGRRFYPDGIVKTTGTTYIVEFKTQLGPRARTVVSNLDEMVELYSVGREGERVRGLLVVGFSSSGEVKELLGDAPSHLTRVAVLDLESLALEFVYCDLLD